MVLSFSRDVVLDVRFSEHLTAGSDSE